MAERPTGTVTFLMTDIEASTQRWEEEPEAMRAALERHDAVLRRAIADAGGWPFKHTGDGMIAAFAAARPAIEAAIAAQHRLELPVRMGISTGEAELRDDDYFGPALNRTARIMAAAHGGQIVVGAATAAIAEGIELIELGEHRLRDLSQPQRLYQACAEGLREQFPPLCTLNAAPGNLPVQATSFLGRERDLAEVAALLHNVRLLTLTGVGGVGKTRLALQVAAELSPDFPEGTWLVELAAVGDINAVGHAVAGILGIPQQPGTTIEQSIVAALVRRRLLLVLDNCEHLIDTAAALAHSIVTQCPGVRVLATSRESLMVDGEQLWPVPSLGFRDGVASPAVALFVERARAVVPQFALDREAAAVAEICRRLDGIPLAIELAAARIRAMSPTQIRDRLDERFRLLTGGPRRALERHQTLRHAVQWSYDLLIAAERVLLARSSVFAGGFTLEAAEHVCAGGEVAGPDVLDLLDSLVRKSLLTVDRYGETTRYGLLETIRQFAEEQLVATGDGDELRRRHAQFIVTDSDAHFLIWRTSQQIVAHRWVEREIDNLRAAFRWAAESGDVAIAAQIASNIGDMARFCLRDEAVGWAAEIVEAARRIGHRRLTVLLTWAASSGWGIGRLDDAKRFGEEAISLAGNPQFEPFVWAYGDLAFIAAFEGDIDRAVAISEEGAAEPADRSDRLLLACVLYFKAMQAPADARAIADDIVAVVEAAGSPFPLIMALFGKGRAFIDADPATALAAFEKGIAAARASGNRMWVALGFPEIAALQARNGDPANALVGFREMLKQWQGAAELMMVSNGIGGLVVLFERVGRLEAAAVLHGMLERAFPTNPFVEELPAAMGRVWEALGDTAFENATRHGAAMDVHQAINYAEMQIERALTELAGGTPEPHR
jgi:predicted ATPase